MNLGALMTGLPRRLSHTPRWSTIRSVRTENVAEHSYYVALFAAAICDELQFDIVGDVVRMALVHDLEEAFTGDVRTTVGTSPRAFAAAVVAEVDDVAGTYFAGLWNAYRDGDGGSMPLEARVVRIADMAAATAYAIEEVATGNRAYCGVLREMRRRWVETRPTSTDEVNRKIRRIVDDVIFEIDRAPGDHHYEEADVRLRERIEGRVKG